MTLLTASCCDTEKNIHYIYSSYICTGMQPDSTKLKKVLNGGKRNQIDARWNFNLEPFSIATINHFNRKPICTITTCIWSKLQAGNKPIQPRREKHLKPVSRAYWVRTDLIGWEDTIFCAIGWRMWHEFLKKKRKRKLRQSKVALYFSDSVIAF